MHQPAHSAGFNVAEDGISFLPPWLQKLPSNCPSEIVRRLTRLRAKPGLGSIYCSLVFSSRENCGAMRMGGQLL